MSIQLRTVLPTGLVDIAKNMLQVGQNVPKCCFAEIKANHTCWTDELNNTCDTECCDLGIIKGLQ